MGNHERYIFVVSICFNMIAAGYTKKDMGGTARDCLAQSSDQRASTPPEIRRYRRSTNLEPGKRFVHYGVAEDVEKMRLGDKIHGMFSESSAVTASDLLTHHKPGELERINNYKAEQVYKSANREKLGKSLERNYVLPQKFTQGMLQIDLVCDYIT